MTDSTIQFFNGKFAKPYLVRTELSPKGISIFDSSFNADNGLYFLYKNCHSVISNDKVFIYLSKNSSDYIVLSRTHEHCEAILSGIKKNQTGWYNRLLDQKWYVLFGIAIVLTIFLYTFFYKIAPTIVIHFISVKQEEKIGNHFYNSFINDVDKDSSSTVLLQKFADELVLSKKYSIQVTVVNDSSTVNAFALPGGHLVVFTGILKRIERPEELVALLSHESSHINQRHSLKYLLSRVSMSVVISLISTDLNGLSKTLMNNVNLLQSLSYSRGLEKEADDEGMKLMVNNRVNPIGMKWLMEDLKEMDKDIPSGIAFLSTHPLTTERMIDADNFAKKYTQINAPLSDKLISIWYEIKNNVQ